MLRVYMLMAILSGLLGVAGCHSSHAPEPTSAPAVKESRGDFYLQPLPVQQAQAYGETVTGRFVSLADFEDAGVQVERGFNQLHHFRIEPSDKGRLDYVVNITRTGAGAMKATLPPQASLVFTLPDLHDWRPYTLLSMAVYSPTVRDDLVITLKSSAGSWSSRTKLIPAGWSTVLVDLYDLAQGAPSFDIRHVETVEFRFSAATEPVEFNLDDIMLIDNTRELSGTPKGLSVGVSGLDYVISLPGWARPIELKQCPDGLWRLGSNQPIVQLGTPENRPANSAEDLRALGERRVGSVEVLEANPVRVRLRNTWYFPPLPGEWIDMEVRQIRWEYTFYADGRWVTSMLLNNAGGEDVQAVRVLLPYAAAWPTGQIRNELDVRNFTETAGAWAFLATPDTDEGRMQKTNFARPAALTELIGRKGDAAAGDADGDGFDESQGCYFVRAQSGNCRVEFRPGEGPLVRPVVFLEGQWKGAPLGNCQGLPLSASWVPDGAVSVIPETITAPARVEFGGPVAAGF